MPAASPPTTTIRVRAMALLLGKARPLLTSLPDSGDGGAPVNLNPPG